MNTNNTERLAGRCAPCKKKWFRMASSVLSVVPTIRIEYGTDIDGRISTASKRGRRVENGGAAIVFKSHGTQQAPVEIAATTSERL